VGVQQLARFPAARGPESMFAINAIKMGGGDILPLVEGGKGVAISNGATAGHWSKAGGVGTISAVNADSYDDNGEVIPQIYHAKTRRERHEELIAYAIRGAVTQAKRAFDITGGKGRIHANILWEMGGAERVIEEVLKQAKGLIHGVTCGAGMPYRLSEIAARFNVHYYPIVSSSRAFNALWRRAYSKVANLLGGVVYEDPWLAGGHNGLSNSEDPDKPEDPYPRVAELRKNNTKKVRFFNVWATWCGVKMVPLQFRQVSRSRSVAMVAFMPWTLPSLGFSNLC